jgi:hypothetical protein
MPEVINKTMDVVDFMLPGGLQMIQDINALIQSFKDGGFMLSGWSGRLMNEEVHPEKDSRNCGAPGQYFPFPGAADDRHFPWFLYWEIFWALRNTPLEKGSWILDAGGSCSLFWAFLCELRRYRVFSCELNKKLVDQAEKIAQERDYNNIFQMDRWSSSLVQDITELKLFPHRSFEAIFSICVMEHLTLQQRQQAMTEFHRTLVPGGRLTMTFDYQNPHPAIYAPDPEKDPKENLLSTPEQLRSSFLLDGDLFEILGNKEFFDNGKRYLGHPRFNYAPYTFGALFLRRR